MKFYGVPLTI